MIYICHFGRAEGALAVLCVNLNFLDVTYLNSSVTVTIYIYIIHGTASIALYFNRRLIKKKIVDKAIYKSLSALTTEEQLEKCPSNRIFRLF